MRFLTRIAVYSRLSLRYGKMGVPKARFTDNPKPASLLTGNLFATLQHCRLSRLRFRKVAALQGFRLAGLKSCIINIKTLNWWMGFNLEAGCKTKYDPFARLLAGAVLRCTRRKCRRAFRVNLTIEYRCVKKKKT